MIQPSANRKAFVYVEGNIGIVPGTHKAPRHEVKPGPASAGGHGYLLGRPDKILKVDQNTFNVAVSQGRRLPVNDGPTANLFTSYKDINPAFTGLIKSQLYIFEYRLPDPEHPDIRKLVAAHDPQHYLQNAPTKVLPQRMVSENETNLGMTTSILRGRIAGVERRRASRNLSRCLLQVQSSPSGELHQNAALIEINQEAMCTYAETLLALNLETEVVTARRSPTLFFATSIKIVLPLKKRRLQLTPEDLAALKEELENSLLESLQEK